MLRTGKQYLRAIQDERQVFLGGELVKDVTKHSAFRNAAASMAGLYDITSDPTNLDSLTYCEKETNEQCNAIFLRPRSIPDLAKRRRVHEAWANSTWGLMGRAPDHVAAFITGMACMPNIADKHDQGFGKNLVNYWRHIRDNDLNLTYAVVPPAGARGTEAVATPVGGPSGDSDWGDNAGLRVTKENDNGVTVWGFKILATGAILADEMLIGNVLPLSPGQEKSAITFGIPVSTPGVKILSRRSYEDLSVSRTDDPLASRYDETDAVIFCDNVHIPWERVFAHNHIDTARDIFYDTPAHTLGNAQAHIRLLSKMRLMLGVIKKVSEVNGLSSIPAVRDKLYELAVRVAMVEGLLEGQQSTPEIWPDGYVSQKRQTMYATMSWTMEYYPQFVSDIRELLGSHPFQQPANSSVFTNDATKNIFESFYLAPVEEAVEKYTLFKLAWDLVGTEFASRHTQYEMFYAGPKHVTRGRLGFYFNWDIVDEQAAKAMDSIGGFKDVAGESQKNSYKIEQ